MSEVPRLKAPISVDYRTAGQSDPLICIHIGEICASHKYVFGHVEERNTSHLASQSNQILFIDWGPSLVRDQAFFYGGGCVVFRRFQARLLCAPKALDRPSPEF